ncbi:MAG: cytochrome C oxidase subunit IV family protein [Dehalococcoidia bacterium]|jgi:heme/copper-type cytochrome/quinol oxidase subunit 4|nr:cytochrome C oxidase subunit IV family protein [Dehalococcoidia bacterium]
MHKTLQQTLKTGWVVIALLGVMTAVEFLIAVTLEDATLITLLLVIALAKSWLIIQYFMHFGQLWQHVSEAWYGMLGDDEDDTDED